MGENLHNEVKVSAVRQNTTCDPFSLTGCTRKCTRDDKTAAVKVKDGFPLFVLPNVAAMVKKRKKEDKREK